ncbi:MAG: O-antigen ligase family protein [Candidatus Firestonebacteria bacterium]|nr:O-antigen ligase family protein [Candidatus Firestonebacteria bacterium]
MEVLENNKLLKITFFSILLSVVTGIIVGAFPPLYGFALIGFLVFISLTIYNISYGILFWILTGGLFVTSIYTIRNAGIYPSLLMLCILLFVWLIVSIENKTFTNTKSKLYLPLVSLIIITILSGLKGGILYDPEVLGEHKYILVQIFSVLIIIFSILTAFLIQYFFETIEQIKLIYLMLIFLGVGIFFEIFISDIFKLNLHFFLPSWDVLLNVHAMSLAYTSLLFIPQLSLVKKLGFIILILFSFESSIMQFIIGGGQWISGWIALGIPLIYITFQKTKIWSLFLIILFSILIFFFTLKQINYMFTKAKEERDYDRFNTWENSSKLWQKNLFFGVGPGNYIDYAQTYFPEGFKYTSAHSQYFQFISEIGSLGTICFFWLIVKIFILGEYIIKRVKENFLKVFVIGIMGSIYGQVFASIFGDYILPSYHNGAVKNICTTIYFWILVGSLMAVEQIVEKEEEKAKLQTTNFKLQTNYNKI